MSLEAILKLSEYQRYMEIFSSPTITKLIEVQSKFPYISGAEIEAYNIASRAFGELPPYWNETIQQLNEITSRTPLYVQDIVKQHSWYNDILQSIDYQLCTAISYSFGQIGAAMPIELKKKFASKLTSFASEINSVEIPEGNYREQADSITTDCARLIVVEVETALSDKKNWQQRLMDVALKYKSENPIIAWFIQQVVVALIIGIVSGIIVNAIGQAKSGSKIREFPNANAQVICTIDKDQNVTITGDAPYYYEVEIESGDEITTLKGFVSKKSVMKLSADDAHENE